MRTAILALTATTLWAQAPAAKPAAPARAAAPAYQTLKFPPLREVKTPEVAQFTLANGMKVYLLENHELPLVRGSAIVRTGSLLDPTGKVGLADMAAGVIRTGGTKSKTGDQLDEELESVAASVECNAGRTRASCSFSALKDTAEQVMAVFKDVILNPEFRQEKIDLSKTRTRTGIQRRNDDAMGLATREFTEIVYGKATPYGRRTEMADVEAITRADMQAWHTRYFFPANTALTVSGDFNSAEMKAKIERLFSDWTATQAAVPPFPKAEPKAVPGVYLADKPEVTQANFRIGHTGGMLKDKDYPALEVAANILGSGFPSRLMKKIRTEKGWAYFVGSNWNANYNTPGLFVLYGGVKTANTVDAISAVQEEVTKMRTTEVTDEELNYAKNSALNSLIFANDSLQKTLDRMVTYDYEGYPRDFLDRYQKGIAAVTKADIQRVAREYFKPENFTYVVVGNEKDLGKPLSSLGLAVNKIDLTIPMPKVEKAASTPQSLASGKAKMAKLLAALGGAEKFAQIKDYQQSSEIKIITPGAKLPATQTTMWMATGAYRQESALPFGKMAAYFDGQGGGFLNTPQGVMPLAGPVLGQIQGQIFREFPLLMRAAAEGKLQVNDAGKGVLEITGEKGQPVKLVVDENTGLPTKLQFQDVSAPQGLETVYEDFRDAGGVKLPFKAVTKQGGNPVTEVDVKEYKINVGLKTEDLAKK